MKTRKNSAHAVTSPLISGEHKPVWEHKAFTMLLRMRIPMRGTSPEEIGKPPELPFKAAFSGYQFAWQVDGVATGQWTGSPTVPNLGLLEPEERRQFWKYFAHGIRCHVKRCEQGQWAGYTYRAPVLLAMLNGKDEVNALGSVEELHRWLVRKLGKSRTGNLKRVEKIAQDLGMHFRPRGRPRKIQKPKR